jgi:hypothetical protein
MLPRFVVLLFLAAASLPCVGQISPAKPPAQIPDLVVYEAFLHRVAWLDALSDKLAAQGKSPAVIRSTIRRQAGLTGPEDAALRAIARDWNTKHLAIVATAKALALSGAQADSPAFQSLTNQRQDTVTGCIGQLQNRFDAVRFQVLDSFIRSSSGLSAIPVTAGVPAAAGGK